MQLLEYSSWTTKNNDQRLDFLPTESSHFCWRLFQGTNSAAVLATARDPDQAKQELTLRLVEARFAYASVVFTVHWRQIEVTFTKHCWRVAGTTCPSTALKPLSNKRQEQLGPSIAASSRHITRGSKRPFFHRKLQQHYPRPPQHAVTRPTSKEKMDSVRNERISKKTPTGLQYNMISCAVRSSLSQPQSYRKHTGHEGFIY